MKNVFVSFLLLAGACSTAPEPQSFLEDMARKSSLKISQDLLRDPLERIVEYTYVVKDGGKLLEMQNDTKYRFEFVKAIDRYVALYSFYTNDSKASEYYFTLGSSSYISELLAPSAPPAPAPDGDFLEKIKVLAVPPAVAGTTVKVDRYKYTVSDDGKTLTETPATLEHDYKYVWVKATGDNSAAYDFRDGAAVQFSKIFTWRNGYYTSETVDFKQ